MAFCVLLLGGLSGDMRLGTVVVSEELIMEAHPA